MHRHMFKKVAGWFSLGRNGFSKTTGVVAYSIVSNGEREVLLRPINSRGDTTQCQIVIPVSEVRGAIAVLRAAARDA